MKRIRTVIALGLLCVFNIAAPAAEIEVHCDLPIDIQVAVLRVPWSKPLEIARQLDELFNGPATARQRRVVVYAIPATKYLIVRASKLDVVTVRELLRPIGELK